VESGIRVDKFLWAVRLFKTRSLAAESCRNNKVLINDHAIKPSHETKIEEVIKIRYGQFTKTVKVVGITTNRVSAKLVANFIKDLTPAEEYKKQEMQKEVFFVKRKKGTGRPTKKERRNIDSLFSE
jgi:ribosome-associated heat shock protein Hsp15